MFRKLLFGIVSVAVLGGTSVALSDVPRLISYQGFLDGVPDGTPTLTVKFWDAASAGNELWSEVHASSPVINGVFTILIGNETTGGVPDSALDNAEVWVGLTVDAGSELPRTRLVMVPYAAKATSAEQLVKPDTFDAAVTVDASGNVGIGKAVPLTPLHIKGTAPSDELDGGIMLEQPMAGGKSLRIAHTGTEIIFRRGGGQGDVPIHFKGVADINIMTLGGDSNIGNIGIGTPLPLTPLHIKGTRPPDLLDGGIMLEALSGGKALRIAHTGTEIVFRRGGSGGDVPIHFRGTAETDIMTLAGNFNVGIGTTTPQTTLDVAGTITTDVLTIDGGMDVAEPFDVSGADAVRRGMVLCIDPADPGRLRLSSGPYDRTVAGIVSGAGGLNPGMTLSQPGIVGNGTKLVALTGRVWCWSDADANGPIEAGDLLTTSGTPGHAMKVTDHGRASGAVLGKAMSRLEEGRGLVLVLVSLQ